MIDGYQIDGVWSEGDLCTVYLASNPITHDHVLIKTLSELHKDNEDAKQALLQEAHVLSLCHHANIAKLQAHGTCKGRPFLVLEFVRGVSLSKILKHNPIPLKKALELFLEICYAVSHLHSLGFVHRDLKPENILITDHGQVKLIDFNLVSSVTEKDNRNEEYPNPPLFAYAGTPLYMSPEALRESSLGTIERDIYALGIIGYEMILGKISYGKVILSLLPKGLQPIIAKAVQPYPENRYNTILEFIQALTSYIESNASVKEKHGSDYFFELFEQAERAQKRLYHSLAPQEVPEASIALSCAISQQGLYATSLKEKTDIGFFVAEFSQKGIEGLISGYTCNDTLVRLREKNTEDLFSLWQQLEKNQKENDARCVYVAIKKGKYLQYSLNDWGELFLIHSHQNEHIITQLLPRHENTPLSLAPEDTIIFVGYEPLTKEQDVSERASLSPFIPQIISEISTIPPSKQSHNILQRLRMRGEWTHKDHPLCILALNASIETQKTGI